jgi:hypothetical protein
MKRMLVPALALGLAFAIARPALAGHFLDGLRHRDGCCEPACSTPRPKCFSRCKTECAKPCETECSKPCDPCGGHRFGSRLRGMFSHLRHRDCGSDTCNTCGNGEIISSPSGAPAPAPAPAPMPQTRMRYEQDFGPRLEPIPSNTTSRTTRRAINY